MAEKAKLERQVLMKKEIDFFRCTLGRMLDSSPRDHFPFCSNPWFYRVRKRRVFFLYPITLLDFDLLKTYPYIFLAFVLNIESPPASSRPIGTP